MGWVMGFEPTNTGTTIRCLRPLGDTHHIQLLNGTPGADNIRLPERSQASNPYACRVQSNSY